MEQKTFLRQLVTNYTDFKKVCYDLGEIAPMPNDSVKDHDIHCIFHIVAAIVLYLLLMLSNA